MVLQVITSNDISVDVSARIHDRKDFADRGLKKASRLQKAWFWVRCFWVRKHVISVHDPRLNAIQTAQHPILATTSVVLLLVTVVAVILLPICSTSYCSGIPLQRGSKADSVRDLKTGSEIGTDRDTRVNMIRAIDFPCNI